MADPSPPRVTMKMIAERLGVSVSTVSLALRSHPAISEETRTRVNGAAKDMGFTQNPVVAQLMSELRKSRVRGYRRTIALLNAHRHVDALANHVAIPFIAEGCRRRATFQGYRCDTFWLHDPKLGPRALGRMLTTRGIRGAIVIGLRDQTEVLQRYAPLWNSCATVVVGARPQAIGLSYCAVDFFNHVRDAVAQAIKLGYKRPALVVDDARDRLVDRRLSAGMWIAQQDLPEADRIPGYQGSIDAHADSRAFHLWRERTNPDVILTFYRDSVVRWLGEADLVVPRDLGLIVLDRQTGGEDFACMDQRGDLLGESAVDILVGLLNCNETGLPATPRAVTTPGVWVPGASVRDQRMRAAAV